MTTTPDLTIDVSRPSLSETGGTLAADVTIEPGRRREATTRHVAVVLDTSGSMRGPKLQEAKRGAELVLGQLAEKDHLAVIAFDDDPEAVIPVLGNEFGFESVVVVCRVVEDSRPSHGSSRSGRASSAPHAIRCRQTHWLERADSRMTDSNSLS
jgi:hypothetical protein